MWTAELLFTIRGKWEEAQDEIDWLLGAWWKNGQIDTESWRMVRGESDLRVIVSLPEPGALGSKHANKYIVKGLRGLHSRGASFAGVRILGTDPQYDEPCVCRRFASLILYTNWMIEGSPVRCGRCFLPVPLYRAPYTHDLEHLDKLSWATVYRACDDLQLHCGTGERFGERQLAQHDSPLSREGREICAALAKQLKVLVYYNLFKCRGSSQAAELARRCPSCGGRWLLKKPWHGIFDFRCDRCSLLSNIACSLMR